jgi:DNA-binding LacI/PurR family transcriptional regulator
MLDIARRAGVSQAAVSYVLNGQAQAKRISPETEKTILDLAREMNYVPHAGARALRMQKTNILCLVNNLIHLNPLAMQMTSSRSLPAICLEAGHHGYRLLIETTLSVERGSDAETDAYREFIHSGLSDGVILSGPAHDDARLKLLRDSGFATVTIGRSEIDEIDSVDSDNRQVARDATAHLIEQGCRRIALLLGDTDYLYHADRLEGYRRALAEAGLGADDSLVQILPESWRDDDGDHLVSLAVDRLWSTMPPDGLFAGVDDMLGRGVR